MTFWLTPNSFFPPLEDALVKPNGLLAAGGDLSAERLIEAYRSGIFPWFNENEPILWWSPNPRMVLFPCELRISRSLNKILRNSNYEVRVDSAFSQVIQACAAPRKGRSGTWIHSDMISAYTILHEMGLAHSVETWVDGELIGGLYGIAQGKMFFGESMFHLVTDASKVALVHLVERMKQRGLSLLDVQFMTPHLQQFGAVEIARQQYLRRLKIALRQDCGFAD